MIRVACGDGLVRVRFSHVSADMPGLQRDTGTCLIPVDPSALVLLLLGICSLNSIYLVLLCMHVSLFDSQVQTIFVSCLVYAPSIVSILYCSVCT